MRFCPWEQTTASPVKKNQNPKLSDSEMCGVDIMTSACFFTLQSHSSSCVLLANVGYTYGVGI